MSVSGQTAVVLSAGPLPTALERWLERTASFVERLDTVEALMVRALRGRPVAVLLDGRGQARAQAHLASQRLKRDSFTGIVPTVVLSDPDEESVVAAFSAHADEVITERHTPGEVEVRLAALLRRAARDTGVHPTTRLPGTGEIEAELDRRIAAGESFATCYADLDHFKEFNDRYGYNEGDRVIRMLALILHDVVKGVCGESGFVGHIGGDDFIFVVPLARMTQVCAMVVDTFEALVPFQYNEADRRAGYYFGKDRRGQLHRVPLMTVSIGVVTTERRRFMRAAQVSELASEMKSYAKTQPGSNFAVDRRTDAPPSVGRGSSH